MADAHENPAPARAALPLTKQNAFRARYKAMRPGWETSGDQLETLVRRRLTPASRVLDLGCGRGGVVELFWRDVELAAGLDPDVPSLSEHRAPGMPVIRGVGERLPFVDRSFDVIVCLWVLEHLKEPLATFAEVRRVLRPGGHFIFLTPNLRHPLVAANRLGKALPRLQSRLVPRVYGRSGQDTFPVQYRANTPRAIRDLARAAGLDVVELRVEPDPTYLALNEVLFRASVLGERLMPSSRGIHLLGDLVRGAD
ncbi:MAG TPA: methyltransferase domain-containing protein [Patescibacteria group bacterium]|nr:methyltransferase domain-containing protein [Patescibacteria group bacterium]